MNDETIKKQESSKHPEFEQKDLSATGILSFLLGLAIFGVVIHFVLGGMYSALNNYQKTHQPPQNPLASTNYAGTREPSGRDTLKFPEPRLEINERTQLNGFRLDEEKKLNSYGWVDQKAGVVHIPIERAMQIVAQRGLPVRPQNANPAQAPSASQPKSKPPGKSTAQAK